MRQAGMKVDTWGYEIISSKHLVGNCVINGRHSMVREREALHCSHTQRQMYRQKETDGKTSLFYVWCAGIHFTFSPHHHRTPAFLSRAHTHKRAHAHSLSVCLSVSLSLSHTHTHTYSLNSLTIIGIESAVVGQVFCLVEAQVPLAHHVGGVPSFLHLIRQGGAVQRKAVGLGWPDDAVLQSRVDLRHKTHDLRHRTHDLRHRNTT